MIGCAVAILIGVAALATSGDFSTLGAVFPRTIAGLMIVLALLYLALAWRDARPAPGEQEQREPLHPSSTE